jgi:hypothetical protein
MDDRTIDFLGGTHNNYHMGSLQVCRNMIYDNLLKLKDELKDKPEEKPKLDRVMSILMRRYDYGVDDMEEYRWGDFRDEIATVNFRRQL